MSDLRWKATAYYRSDSGPIDVEHDFEELFELHDLLEKGPHWSTLIRIEIVLNRNSDPGLTLEEAEKL